MGSTARMLSEMGFTWENGRTLVDLIDEMSPDRSEQIGEPVRGTEGPVDWSNLRDIRVQGAMLQLIRRLGEPHRARLQAEVAHLPQLAARIPRFLEWARRQGWVRVARTDDQGHRFELTGAGATMIKHAAPLPQGSHELTPSS